MVGDLALHLVAVGADPAEFADDPAKFDIPGSVIGFLHGELGDPPGGWPEPFRTKALEGRSWEPASGDLAESDAADLAAASPTRRRTLNRLLFPGPTREFEESRQKYGDVSVLPTRDYLYGLRASDEHVVDIEEGKRVIFGLEAIGEPDERGFRTVMATINGQLRPIPIRDQSVVRRRRRRREGGHVEARPGRPPPSRAPSPSWSPRATRSTPARPSPPSRR